MGEAYLVPELSPLNRHRLGALTALGRHPENTIEIPDRSVSKFHAQIQRTHDGRHILQDLGSRNGTYVAGQRVERYDLSDGDELVLGTVRFRFREHRQPTTLTSSVKLSDVLNHGGGVTMLGPALPGSLARVELTEGDSSIEHSNAYDVSQDRFLPADEMPDFEALRRDYEKLRIAHELSSSLRLDAPLDEVLRAIAERSFDLLPADRCAILLMSEDGRGLQPTVVMERGGGEPEGALPLSSTVLNEVIAHKKAVLSTDAITDGRFHAAASIVALSMRSAMCVPLIHEDEIYGAMHVDSLQRTNAFTQKDLQIFTTVAKQAAMVLKNAALLGEVQRESETRARLGRLLSPNLLEEVVAGKLSMAPGGEQRAAAVMFTDIRGFTSTSEQLDASEVTALLNEYFEVMVDVLFQNGGTLDKYLGDGMMALFGVPKDDEGSCDAAVRCALRMLTAMRSLNRIREARGEAPISTGIGINFGEVIWGPLGSRKTMDYTVVGDVVNTASRMCGIAPPEHILITQAVVDRLSGHYRMEELPAATVKGKAEALRVWRVLADLDSSQPGGV
jgi:adenylate cyclase